MTTLSKVELCGGPSAERVVFSPSSTIGLKVSSSSKKRGTVEAAFDWPPGNLLKVVLGPAALLWGPTPKGKTT